MRPFIDCGEIVVQAESRFFTFAGNGTYPSPARPQVLAILAVGVTDVFLSLDLGPANTQLQQRGPSLLGNPGVFNGNAYVTR